MTNTILRKKIELENENKKLPSHDAEILNHVSPILYKELAISLDISTQEVTKKIERIIKENV
ncbi:hypothetical protein D3C76_1011280 [compost metagenome]